MAASINNVPVPAPRTCREDRIILERIFREERERVREIGADEVEAGIGRKKEPWWVTDQR